MTRHTRPRLRHRLRVRPRLLIAGLTALACLGVIAVAPQASSSTAGGTGRSFYLDCDSGDDAAAGTSPRRAWRSLERVGAVTFRPGDRIQLKRGVTCTGVLSPQGSGTAGAPIVVTSYGSGAPAHIAGAGARAAVFLRNVQGWELRDLEISNTGPAGPTRAGVYVLLEDFGVGRHYVMRDLRVHDVVGCDCTGPTTENSGGIIFTAAGTATPTGFAGVRVVDNELADVDGIGIGSSSLWAKRDINPDGPGEQFVPMTGLFVHGNSLTGMGGDGIAFQNAVDGLVQHNLVDGYALRANTYHAGIWAWNADRVIFQYNEVAHGGGAFPALAYDIDRSSRGIVYQYNYSHDNVGGFILFCADQTGPSDGAVIRYNISQNDLDDPSHNAAIITIVCYQQTNVRFEHNVIYAPEATNLVNNYTPVSVSLNFTNNIFVGRPGGSAINDANSVFDHNVYHQVTSAPASDANAILADPKFVGPGLATGRTEASGYQLATGSPALNAGARVTNPGLRDYYGNRLRPGRTPNIGAYAGPGIPAS